MRLIAGLRASFAHESHNVNGYASAPMSENHYEKNRGSRGVKIKNSVITRWLNKSFKVLI
jgi:hypothetical protein